MPQWRPVAAGPTTSSQYLDLEEEKTQRYCHCNECGPSSYCIHSDDDDPPHRFHNKTDTISVNQHILGARGSYTAFLMLNPQNLSGLLTENVDEHASGYLVFTDHGTLLGYSDGTLIKYARKASALTALTWRLNEAAMLGNPTQAAIPSISAAPLTTIETAATKGGEELQTMVTEVDDMTLVVEYVKERLLLASMKETAEVYKGVKQAEANENDSGNGSVISGGVEGGESGTSVGEGGLSTGPAAGGSAKSDMSASADVTGAEGFTELQILKLKTEGLRDALRADLKDFKMPKTFT